MSTPAVSAANLRCEYLENPIGIDHLTPRLSWIFQADGNARGLMQSAYAIVAAASEEKLAAGEYIWDTGRVDTDQCSQIQYAGNPLAAGSRVYWMVKLWDNSGQESDWSAAAHFEIGLLDKSNWQAKWIGPFGRDDIYQSYPAPLVRKEFELAGDIATARLYITTRGLYEAKINGQDVTDNLLTPGWTDYKLRHQYNTYDVTSQLAVGKNAIGVTIADGWYSGNIANFHSKHRGRYGQDPQLLAQLVVTYADDKTETIITDESWKWSTGEVTSADIYKGEKHDARKAQPGFDTAGFDDSDWQDVKLYDDNDAILTGKCVEPVRVIEEIAPIAISENPEGVYIFDMGQNMVGRALVRVKLKAGQTVTLRHVEMLQPDGTIYTDNLRSADQLDTYTAAADGTFDFTPKFTFHGFRYLAISGLDYKPDIADVTGQVMHNAMALTGKFTCSEADLNQLQSNIKWGQRGNYLEVPTDCPQRDERLGWTGDAQVFIRTGAFNYDVAAFFTKWLADLEDSQRADGNIPFVAPDTLSRPEDDRFAGGAAAWGDAAVICPWTIYLSYGDKNILETSYKMMAGWVDYMLQTSTDLLRPKSGFGDWLAMDAPGTDNAQTATPKDLVGTAYFAYCSAIMAKVAKILGKTDDIEKYTKLAEDVRAAFNREYITPSGRVMGDTQTSYSMAINMDLIDDSLKTRAAELLVKDIEAHKDHITTGFVGVNQIMFALTDTGNLEHNYRLLFQDTYPSWLMPVKNGATTIWERWDGWTPDKGFQSPSMNSYNHYAYGCVGEWLYRCCAGLDIDENAPGYEHVIIRPNPDPTGRMTWAKAELESARGHIESGWKVENGSLTVEATIPPNATATVILKADNAEAITESGKPLAGAEGVTNVSAADGCVKIEIGSGKYSFSL